MASIAARLSPTGYLRSCLLANDKFFLWFTRIFEVLPHTHVDIVDIVVQSHVRGDILEQVPHGTDQHALPISLLLHLLTPRPPSIL
jgi:hypothetical protein